jgi:hypothetical protein
MTNKIMTEKECVYCKVGSGLVFLGFSAFHGFRMYNIWKFYPMKDKVFNLFALGVLLMISGANFNAAY